MQTEYRPEETFTGDWHVLSFSDLERESGRAGLACEASGLGVALLRRGQSADGARQRGGDALE